jgi:hypothetical protein
VTPQAAKRVVGIGASTGGIEAFHRFFENMPDGSGMLLVVLLALSTADGKITVRSATESGATGDDIVLHRRESGGPSVTAPQTRGAASTIIARGFAHELSGRVDIIFDTQGVPAILRAPVERALARGPFPESGDRS